MDRVTTIPRTGTWLADKGFAGLLCVGGLALALPLGILGLGLLVYIWLILRVRWPLQVIRTTPAYLLLIRLRSLPLLMAGW